MDRTTHLASTNAELPLSDVRTIGEGGMLSTVPDLAQFTIAHMTQGQAGGVQILEPQTMALMHEEAVTFPLGYGDLNQVSCGLGLGHLYDMHGATGHGGSWWLRPASPASHFPPSPMICTPAQ